MCRGHRLAGCLLPKALERVLGKPLGTRGFHTLGGPRETESIYAAPKLYLGKIPLMTADTIGTWDNPLGVLGMNCLRHYCIQLDFQAGKIRFLDPERVDPAELGKSFPLISTRYAYIRHPSLLGQTPSHCCSTPVSLPIEWSGPTSFLREPLENNPRNQFLC